MFFDTTHNSTRKVLDSLRGAFCETASKMWAYIRCLPRPKRPGSGLVIRKQAKHTRPLPCSPPAQQSSFARNGPCLFLTVSLGTISRVVTVAFLLLTGRSRKMRYAQYACDVRKEQVAL